MADDTTQVVGTIPDTKAYSKTRRDERFVLIEQKNLEINSQDEYIVLDELEAGTLQSIKITMDNPYVQVLLQVDEFRNKDPSGQCAAEIIYNGNSDNPNRSFKVIDGQSSSKGYTLEYKPDFPEEYNKRIRLVIRNSIKSTTSVFGMGLNYTSAGNLPTPAIPAHMAGGTFSHPALETLSLAQISRAMTKPVGVEGYSSNNVYNESAIMNDSIELGSDHPYEGIAGKPTFVRDVSSKAFMEIGAIDPSVSSPVATNGGLGGYVAQVIDEPEAFPGSSASPSQMKVRFTPFTEEYVGCAAMTQPIGFYNPNWWARSTIRRTDLMAAGPFGDTWPGTSTYTPFSGGTALDGTVVPASQSIIGKRMFLRRGGTIYFPGVVKSVTKTIAPMGLLNSDELDTIQGFGRELDPDDATKLTAQDVFHPIGVHQQAAGKSVIVMPFLNTAASNASNLDGVVVGSTENKSYTLDGGATSYQQVELTLNSSGVPSALEVVTGGTGYTNGAQLNVATSGGSGTGDLKVNYVGVGNAVTAPTINFSTSPTGYKVGDIVTVSGGGGDATLRVTAINTSSRTQDMLAPITTSHAQTDYNVIMTPHTPWMYTFTFEPGTKETPIDYPLLYLNEADRDLTGLPGGCAAEPRRTSDGTVFSGDDFGKGLFPASEINSWGTVTSQADKNPKVLIKSIEVKRNKRVSYEG